MSNQRFEFHSPATCWEETILLGNGSTGLALWGGHGRERIQLNHDTFWAGNASRGDVEVSPDELDSVRRLIFDDRFAEAEAILEEKFVGPYTFPYQPMGTLEFDFDAGAPTAGLGAYRRALDMSDATYRHSYETPNGTFLTEGFVSGPLSLAVLRFSTAGNVRYNGIVRYEPSYDHGSQPLSVRTSRDNIVYRIRAPYAADGFMDMAAPEFSQSDGIEGSIAVRIRVSGGTSVTGDGAYVLKDVPGFCMFIRLETDWGGVLSHDSLTADLERAAGRDYRDLLSEHQSDYRSLYLQTELSLGESSASEPTVLPDRLLHALDHPDPGLVELLFNFGRYLLIASSRSGSQPANLQGIWNAHTRPPWWSNFTLNINTEMNYWGANATGLGDCATPLYDFAIRLMESGHRTAKQTYGCDGFCVHHQTDIWATTNARGRTATGVTEGNVEYSIWPFGGVWLALMAWHHYEYTGDEGFLESRAAPLLEGSVRFLKGFIVETADGTPTTNPSTSPENRFRWNGEHPAVSHGSTMDLSLCLETIQAYLALSRLITCDSKLVEWCNGIVPHLNPLRIGRLGQLREWSGDWDRESDKHRHVSHLFGLYPGKSLMGAGMERFREAAGKSLEMRGLAATGWSTVWKVALAARLGAGDLVDDLMGALLTPVKPGSGDVRFTGSGLYPNLLCAHPPFQIDANLGIVAAILETIVREIDDSLVLLPALPEMWLDGQIRNLRLRHGLVVSIKWARGRLSSVSIVAKSAIRRVVSHRDMQAVVVCEAGTHIVLDENLQEVSGCV